MFISKCRMCSGSSFYKFLDLAQTPPADQFLFAEQLNGSEESYPLEVVVCETCSLVQLNYVVPPEILYCEDYPYESSEIAGRFMDDAPLSDDVSARVAHANAEALLGLRA